MSSPQTLQQAIQYFSTYENCKDFMVALRWPNGVTCPQCGSTKVTYLENAKLWKCYSKHAKPKFSLKTGTLFEDSAIGLDKWLPVMWLLVNCKNGVSSYEIMRDMGVTQKTAWFMLQRGRMAMQEVTGIKLSGEVEVDESFIGGKARNMHTKTRKRMMQGANKGKTIAVGMVERGGKVKTAVVERRTKKNLQDLVRKNVEAGAAIFSDELLSYDGLSEDFQHAVINTRSNT
jgi:transposase-like protein